MSNFVLMTDSCCDLPESLAKELELEVLPLSLELEGKSYRNLLDGSELGFQDFYSMVRAGKEATTSAISVGAAQEAMSAHLREGRDVLAIHFSSALSATYQSSCIAAEELREEFPERKIYVVDSLCASLGQGLLLCLCAKEKQKGMDIDSLRDYAETTKKKVCHWFTVDDLHHLKRGGRVSGATAFFGTMLSIKPVLHVDDEGRLIPVSKTRGRKASLVELVDRMEQTAENPAEQTVFLSHGDSLEDAEFVAKELRQRLGVKDIVINYIGPVIGNHAGPGTIALFFLGNKR